MKLEAWHKLTEPFMPDHEPTLEESLQAQLSDTKHIWIEEKSISYCKRCGKRPDQLLIETTLTGVTYLPCKGFIG